MGRGFAAEGYMYIQTSAEVTGLAGAVKDIPDPLKLESSMEWRSRSWAEEAAWRSQLRSPSRMTFGRNSLVVTASASNAHW